MRRLPRHLNHLLAGLTLAILSVGVSTADDRDLLRDQGGNPFLFIALDNSTSMNLKIGDDDVPAVGYGDDPASRIYQAKEALFEVLESEEAVNLGFTTFNQDQLSVNFFHYLYFHSTALPPTTSWPLDWPRPETGGLITLEDSDGDGLDDRFTSSIDGDILVFGEEFRDAGGSLIPGGTCGSPLDLDDDFEREQANNFGKLGTFGTVPTEMWVASGPGKGKTYHLTVVRLAGGVPGDASLSVRLDLRQAPNKCSDFDPAMAVTASLPLVLGMDPLMDSFVMTDLGDVMTQEANPGYWPWSDAVSAPTCGGGRPHSGLGWEGNYDGSYKTGDPGEDPVDQDVFCDPNDPGTCVDLLRNPTIPDSQGRHELDRGDMLPFDWRTSNRFQVLQRLSPSYPDGMPNFGVTPHLEALITQPNFGLYEPKLSGRPPIVAAGTSPIANAIVDFQCWYKGVDAVSTNIDCGTTAFDNGGWANLACHADPKYGCRKPYFVIVTDGGDSCDNANPRSDINRMFRESGVKTWVVNVGDPRNCTSGNLSTWIKAPGNPDNDGICVTAQTKNEMVVALRDILGEIQDDKRAFASAAVPSVQANVNQSIYLSSFTPFNEASVWQGNLDAFTKPLQFDADGRPVIPQPNHQWSAGEVMKTQQYDPSTPAGFGSSQRRVFYNQQSTSGQWPNGRSLLATTNTDPDSVRYDLWRALGLVGSTVTDGSLSTIQEDLQHARTQFVLDKTLLMRSAVRSDSTVVEYLLGDTFHADPVVIASPDNSKFFDFDLGEDQDKPCNADDSTANSNRGYRCFFLRHLFRRRTLIAGANDGMLHAYNIGLYDTGSAEFDNGSGHETWAYMPRLVMPRVRQLAEGDTHKYTVDGRASGAAAFIDPLHNGTPTPAERLWRTVIVGGLREGGTGYYALDVTQPERLTKTDPDPAVFGDERFFPAGTFTGAVPGCSQAAGAGCGPLPYPAVLWEFTDTTHDSLVTTPLPAQPVRMDEDGNGAADLADTWSSANIGAIQVCKQGASDCTDPVNFEMRFVAIFGGGNDPVNKDFDPNNLLTAAPNNTVRGNWLYMVDVETGKVIYKRPLLGAAPAVTSIVDTDQDAIVDRIYIGTLAGLMYRVDVGPVGLELPQLETVTNLSDLEGGLHTADRILNYSSGGPAWEPVVLFDANYDGTTRLTIPRNIFFRPSVIFVANLGKFGLAFGTGDREDLWVGEDRSERFYVFVDDSDDVDQSDSGVFPFRESFLEEVGLTDLNQASGVSFLAGSVGEIGWYLPLESKTRVTSESFSLSGVTFFSSFTSRIDLEDDGGNTIQFDPDIHCGDSDFEENTTNSCASRGSSAVFVVNTTNANGFLPDGADFDRFKTIDDVFVSSPFTEPTVTEDSSPAPGSPPPPPPPPKIPPDLFPPNCKFASYAERISVVASDTSLTSIADVPICIIEKNWKEF